MIARHVDGKAVDYKKAAYARIHSCNESTVRKRVSCKSVQMARALKDSICSNRPYKDLEDPQLACAEFATTSAVTLDCTNVLGTSIQAKSSQP